MPRAPLTHLLSRPYDAGHGANNGAHSRNLRPSPQYAIVFGAFLFLVPFLMKKPLWSIPLANWTCGLLAVGTFTFWFAGFLSEYAPLYTLYWPLPADFTQFSLWGGTFFIVGIALVMVGTVFFVVNIFKSIA